ncbi:putative ribonuclease H-like domain-containing protein [Tanacetum coccineum]
MGFEHEYKVTALDMATLYDKGGIAPRFRPQRNCKSIRVRYRWSGVTILHLIFFISLFLAFDYYRLATLSPTLDLFENLSGVVPSFCDSSTMVGVCSGSSVAAIGKVRSVASYQEEAIRHCTATINQNNNNNKPLLPQPRFQISKLHSEEGEEYENDAMEMEHYLEYIDNDVWKVIQNGNSKKRISTRKDGVVRILPPVSAAEIHAVEKERKARTILLMAIPKEHLRRFHGMDDAKEIWEAIRTRFGGNANSKKMQKAVLKQQFEAFSISSSEGLEKGYDRFQQLLSQLEAHGAEVSTEDANHKFLRSLPSAWSNLAMTMRTKPDVDTLSIDDLYNNLRVFEQELTSTSKSSASAQNVAFVSHSKSSTNKVKSGHTGAYSTYTPTSSNNIQERSVPAGFADEVIYSLFAKQSEDLDLLHEDLEQIDDVDIEEMDINWQIAMIAIRMKKFYKKTGRRVRIDGNKPVGFDKKKLECFKCHNTGHFARECPSKGTNDGKKRDSFYQDQGAGKKEQNQNCLLTMDDGVVNWGEHTVEEEETNHALMAISSNNEVSLCSKTCIDSYNKLKTLCDEQMNQLGEQEAKILAYTLAVKKLEAQIVTFQKQQLSLNEQLTFQANEIYAKDEKLKRYRRIGMKAVKEKEQLQKIVDSWKNSSKNLWKLVDSEKDFLNKPLYSRFSKTDNFKGVPHPLTGDYTPKPQEEIDDSLYVYGKKGPQKPEISDSDDNSTEHSTCQSNDNEGSFGNPSEHSSESESESISVPNEMSASKSVITNEKVVYESKEVEPSCATHVKTPRQQMKNQGTSEVKGKNWNKMMERELGEGYSFIKKKCFVCGSLSHLIKDCDYYEKKMAREVELKKQRVFNTGNGVAKPIKEQLPQGLRVNTGRTKQPVPTCNTNNFSHVRPQGTAVKTSAGYNWRRPRPNSNYNSGSNFVRTDHPLKNMEDKGIFDSGCSRHMTGNKDRLDDFEECKRGSVTFGGSKGYITGKGRIRVGNLDFDSVSFIKELGHFNLFSISQICDKKHKVLFTKTECLVVSPDFKMPHENQILRKVPRQNNMYRFDMQTPGLTKDYACLIAKATSDVSKLWHRRFSWVFFLATKDETSGILQNFIRQIENQLNHRVKIIRSDNGTEFKNKNMLEFCRNKGIKQEYSNARTPQQNGVVERMNRTLIEAARTMLADSLLPTTFWAEAVSTACYIFNRVRVTKPQNKTPYELLFGHKPIISYIRPFGCHVTILDTLSVLGKFDGKCDEGFLVGYSLNSKAYRVYNLVTKRVEVNLHVNFLEEKPNVKGVGYRWMFDIDYLTDSMNYIPVSLENQAKPHAGTSAVTNHAGTSEVTNSAGTPNTNASEEEDEAEELIIVPTAVQHTAAKVGPRKSSTTSKAEESVTELQNLKTQEKEAYSTGISEDSPEILAFRRELDELAQKHLREVTTDKATSTNSVNSGSEPANTQPADQDDSDMPELIIFNKPQKGIFDEAGMVHDFNNLPTEVVVSPIPTLRIHNIHPQSQILSDPKSSVQTRSRVKQTSGPHALRNLKRFFKLLKMTVGLKLCKKSCYSLGCNKYGFS